MRVVLVQLGYGDDESVGQRVGRVERMVSEAVDGAAVDLVVLPELWPPGGFDYRRWEQRAEPVDGPVAQAMSALAGRLGVVLHAGSIVERLPQPGVEGRSLANTALLYDRDGSRLAAYRKIHRFGFGSGEPVLMEAGEEVVVLDLPIGPGGSPVRTGLSTCYDLRFPELYRRQLDAGARLFVVPAAWPMARVTTWSLLGRARAIENQCILLAVNTSDTHAGVTMGGASQVVGPLGQLWAQAGAQEQVLVVDVDLATVGQAREDFPVLGDRRL